MVGRAGQLEQLTLARRPTPGRASRWSAARRASARPASCGSSWPACPTTPSCSPVRPIPAASAGPSSCSLDALRDELPVDDDRLVELRRPDDGQAPLAARLETRRPLVAEVIDGRPAALVFDDLHWADSESVAVFERIAGADDGPSLVVGTYRPTEVNRRHPLAEALPRLERRPSVAHLRLTRLDVVGVQDFLAAVHGGTVAVPGGRDDARPHRRQPLLPRAARGRGRRRAGGGARLAAAAVEPGRGRSAARSTTSSRPSAT